MTENKQLDGNQESPADMIAADDQYTPLQEGIDYYYENGLIVFTAEFLGKRGYCCEQGCRNCPYGYSENKKGRSDVR